jgi:diguanylate cyclase (GGDEF)-like protein
MDMIGTQARNSFSLENEQLEMLITSIVEVTKQRERIALEDCFSRLICRLTDAKSLIIFHLQAKKGEVFAIPAIHLIDGELVPTRDANIRPFALSSNPLLSAKLQKPYTPGNPDDTTRVDQELVLPLQGAKGEISAFCLLENARNDSVTQRILPLLLEFYLNFLALIDDNERDTLTGLLNRKTFDLRISKLISTLQSLNNRTADKSEPVKYYLAVLDIDHFKHVNDTFGHIYGDEVLLLFANLMKKTFRDNDLLFRFGGEEFVVLLANSDIAQANIALERFRSSVEKYKFPQVGQVTVSIGVALISTDEMPRSTIDRADQALYFAKQNGRNQIRVYEDLLNEGLLKEQNIQTGDIELF